MMALCLAFMPSCRTQKAVDSINSAIQQKTTALAFSGDGNLTLRVWGRGQSKGAALEAAMKQAVYDVLFEGIKAGPAASQFEYPMMPQANAYERYARYFEPFFSTGGEYKRFVHEDNTKSALLKADGDNMKGYSVLVVVNTSALKAQLRRDGLLN